MMVLASEDIVELVMVVPSSVATKFVAVIKAIELAHLRILNLFGWKLILLQFFLSCAFLNWCPWQLRVEWKNCLHRISQIHFRSSHIYRKGNQVVDALGNRHIFY
ncbi:hypothetical protein DVH24_014064 [Malus domestica]|uniref:RNase H type-1 domain-containing protein n=1 Tax=Malus domestica TaxID=3750 RepID=A0A498JCM1_MALDO|nr:hypothetical protein DVH24_014064 [Malus domestica]